MSIKRTIITTVVALALVAVVAPVGASALTAGCSLTNTASCNLSDLGTLIAQLQGTLAGLQANTGATPVPTGVVACAGVTFTRNLTVGSTGQDVKCLQVLMNTNGYTLAATGAGSPGMETSYFGPRTLVVVRAFQVAKGWTPANQVGPLTRAALNALLSVTPPVVTTFPAGCTSTVGYSVTTGLPCNGAVVVPTGTISAVLASDNPAAGAIINSQATADLLHINFVGTGTVTSLTLQRSGISTQNTLQNVYLFDGNTRITDGYSFNASSQLVMNGLNITVNGSHTISVRVDTASDAATYASSIAVALTNYTGNSTATSANVQGNTFMIVAGSAAAVNITTAASTAVPAANVNAGVIGYTFWSAPIQVSTRSVLLKTANFRMVGSAPIDALANIHMFIDGVDTGKVATVITINGSNYASFDLTSAPITLTTGSHVIDVRADVQKGTNRDVTMSVQQASDLTITDPQVGVNIAVSSTTAGSFVANSAGKISILTGSVTVVVDPTFIAQTNISGGSTNAVIGKFKIHAYGEDVKVNTLQVNPLIVSGAATGCVTDANGDKNATTACGLQNVTLYFNGSQVGTQKNFTQTASTNEDATDAANDMAVFSLGSQMIIPAGTDSTLEVRADLLTTGGYAYTSGSVKVVLPYKATATTVNYLNAQGQSSQSTVSIPTSAQSTTGLAVEAGNLVVTKSNALSNQTVSPNQTGVKIGSYVISNLSTSQAVRLTTLKIGTFANATASTPVSAGTWTYINDLSALRTTDVTGNGSTPVQPGSSDTTFSVNDTLAPGASMNLDVYANIGSATSATEYFQTQIQVVSIGVVDNTAAYYPTSTTYTTGQVMTLSTGAMDTPTLVVSSTTPAQYVASALPNGATNASRAAFSFVSTSGSATISELKFNVTNSSVTKVCVGTICSGNPVAGVATVSGLSLAVPNGGGGLTINADVSYPGVGTGGLVPGTSSLVSLSYVKYTAGGTPKASGDATQCAAYTSPTCTTITAVAAKTITLQGAVPVVAINQTTPASNLVAASTGQHIGQVTVTASATGGAIKVNTITFSVGSSGWTATPAITSPIITLGGQTSTLAGSTCTGSGTTITCTLGAGYTTDFVISSGQSQVFDLFATVGGTQSGVAISSISTSVTAAGFLWDDTSYNGVGASNTTDTAITGTNIYNFPTNSYTNHL